MFSPKFSSLPRGNGNVYRLIFETIVFGIRIIISDENLIEIVL